MNLLDFLISNKLIRLKRAIAFMFVVAFALPVFSQHDDHIDESLLSAKKENKFQVNSISLVGNKRTKASIITRELTFAIGDSLNLKEVEKLIARSQQNLLNSSLFNFATITYQLNEELGAN
jgi:outer membrane protein assembly factor BamA